MNLVDGGHSEDITHSGHSRPSAPNLHPLDQVVTVSHTTTVDSTSHRSMRRSPLRSQGDSPAVPIGHRPWCERTSSLPLPIAIARRS
jgi:hypothetical protein